jgi:1,4-alpha-glucan branching enzyme
MKKFTIKFSGVLLAFGLIMGIALQSNATQVTFRVNMSNETVSPLGVHIAGSFQSPPWQPGTTPLAAEPFGGIYKVTVDIPEGTTIQYKFINGNDWGMDEYVPASCAYPGSTNRFFTVPAGAVTLPAVCFGNCVPCLQTTDVTFRVDMSEQTVTSGVSLAGQFTYWGNAPLPMIDMGNGVWEITATLDPGETYEYKFINSGSWEQPSGPCTQNGNRVIVVPDDDVELDIVCYGQCIPCAVPTVAITFQVDMEYVDVSPSGVHIYGTFNEWDPTADIMTLNTITGFYEISLDLSEGDYIEYKFVNGNTSAGEETVPQECSANNNRWLTLPFENTTLDAVCYGQCAPCGEPPVDVQVTFQVDMSDQDVSPDGVHIAGSFQGWNPGITALTDAGGGIYNYTTTLQSGYYHEYKFVNGNIWDGAEFIPEECAFNGNRFITIPSTTTTLDLVCFGACEACPPPPEVEITFVVDMNNETVSGDGVHLAGSFNQWDPTANPMLETRAGIFTATIILTAEDVHTYKFVNGLTLDDAEIVPEECGVPYGAGGFARELIVPGVTSTLDEVCFGECDLCIPLPKSMVTFQVDMSTENIAAEGVHLAGSFQGWNPAATPMNDAGGGLYTLTLSLVEGAHQTYKFVNGISFDGAEIVPAECGEDNGSGIFNRFFDVPVNDTTLALVCYGRCTECPPPIEVIFLVDMSNEEVSPEGVHIVGSFQGWDSAASPMNFVADGVYSYAATLFEGDYHEYKFINGNSWINAELVPAGCAQNGNRYMTVPAANTELGQVCFGSCTICVPPSVEVKFQVDMSNETVSEDGVHIAGSFQGWDPSVTQMQDDGDNVYSYTAILNAGESYEFKYINGISFDNEEIVPAECSQNTNRYFIAPDVYTELDLVCFGGCSTCPQLVSVLFQVDMALQEVSPDGVHLIGDFQGWDPAATPMATTGGSVYSVELMLEAGTYQTFKYVNGNSFDGAESVPPECGVDDGFGGFKRFVDVPMENSVLDIVCFTLCSTCTQEHAINIPAGWSGLSSWVMPDETDIATLLNEIYPELIILQTMDAMYYPSEGVNTIGTWESQSAYKIKVSQEVSLNITGFPEQNHTLQLAQGWNLVPVVSNNPVDVVDLFSSVSDKLVVVKGIADNGVYWLEYEINTMVNMMPGKAYFVLMNEAGEITFP